ncbi:hypothetical protein AB0Y38_05650 [Lysinibacillus capsici]|uniref:hypothetical protein n=1 Tax=Lysinibacillus capsici TaxID=2115968 RepID=UPI003F1F5D84
MSRWRISNPFPIPLPNPIPLPGIRIGGTLGEAFEKVQTAVNSLGNSINYRNDFFDKLNDEAKKLVNDMEEWVAGAGGITKEELVSQMVKRVTPKFTAETSGEMFNNLFKNEAVALFNELYSSAGAQTCMFVVAGLMLAAAAVLVVTAPETTTLVDGLISGAFTLAAAGCAVEQSNN